MVIFHDKTHTSVLFFSRPRSEGWPHDGCSFSVCLSPTDGQRYENDADELAAAAAVIGSGLRVWDASTARYIIDCSCPM